jgi:hypothetical protein
LQVGIFQLKDDLDHNVAVKMVQEEVERYKAGLVQYNTSPVGDYLD